MRRAIIIDIETLPAIDHSVTGSRAETSTTAIANQGTDLKSSLNGDFGRILCIGFIDERARAARLNADQLGRRNLSQ
jgi:hypothetical protein